MVRDITKEMHLQSPGPALGRHNLFYKPVCKNIQQEGERAVTPPAGHLWNFIPESVILCVCAAF